MAIVNLTIDGQKVEARSDMTILEAAQQAGIHIPTLCHHSALAPAGSCRVCLVEVSRHQPLYPSCTYRVSEGLTVETRSERVMKARRFVLDMIFSERNHYCMFCEMSGNCELQDLGYEYGLDHWVYPTYQERFPVDATRDTFLMDHNRCVLCRRCVRACAELVANHTLGMRQRGARTMITADLNVPFGDSSCISCGTCLQVCPTGALIDKASAFMDVGRHAEVERVLSVCTGCSVGCGIEIVTRGGNVVRIDGDWDAAPNRGLLCEKGRFRPLADGRRRITRPLARRSGASIPSVGPEPAGWDTALELAARGLAAAGGKAGLLASTTASNEALELAENLFCGQLGAAQAGILNAAASRLPVAHGTLADIAAADLILLVGAEPAAEQPVVSFLVKRRIDQGARLLLVDGGEGMAVLAHRTFDLDQIDEAVEVAGRAESPVVLYGPALPQRVAEALVKMDGTGLKTSFITLEPGANTRGAVARGFTPDIEMDGLEALYVLLGDEAWNPDWPLPGDGTFLVVQASYASLLTERADVILPSTNWAERSGTFTNLEGRDREARAAVQPAGEARMDWEIVSLLADKVTGGKHG
jgi:formate dehydrogenase major subunit